MSHDMYKQAEQLHSTYELINLLQKQENVMYHMINHLSFFVLAQSCSKLLLQLLEAAFLISTFLQHPITRR
jgi:hypothetical protein